MSTTWKILIKIRRPFLRDSAILQWDTSNKSPQQYDFVYRSLSFVHIRFLVSLILFISQKRPNIGGSMEAFCSVFLCQVQHFSQTLIWSYLQVDHYSPITAPHPYPTLRLESLAEVFCVLYFESLDWALSCQAGVRCLGPVSSLPICRVLLGHLG